ncbi:Rho GTPase activation protein [Collybia nuda]|uniref:Rho GTPase activation protein n=1 Tax=Collybia nuda TaxID=64659 RepID=A0A9P5Y074_9AGAR|nr:Rho GTPase activation protein [Collybia nuda]
MSESWDHSMTVPGRLDLPNEFLISAELYVSTAAAASLRKPVHQRKKTDKRESSMGLVEDGKKIKEKSSWLALAKGPSGTGHWRSATCRLSEEGDRCLFNIYVDESILYQTIYIHLLNQTDIRQADSSLFFRKECIGIYCIAGQRWTSTYTAEPVYLQFSNTDSCNTWLALLRSYAIPEIYGRWSFPSDGGSYRMWRQVELTVSQGRNLGNTRSFDIGGDIFSEPDSVDLGVSCEIHLNDILCGRTTVKKGIGSPDWHESFTFSDLPPFESLDLMVWREKKMFKPAILGSIRIPLSSFRRGEAVEGWFPVLHRGSASNDTQVGELRLKMRIDEEIILPYSAYSRLLKAFNTRNFLDWMSDFESHLKLKTASTQLMSVAVAGNILLEHVQELASREVDGTPSSHQTLFRGNTILTKTIELCMAWYGKAFLEASIGSVLRRLCAEKVAIEVDPLRSGKSTRDLERNVDQLIYWCQQFWNQIYSVRTECPQEMRRLFETIRTLVEQRYKPEHPAQEQNRDLPRQSVSAFCFLRFIVPAILHPHLFGLCPGLPSVPVQRSLTLIAKVIQSLANLNASVQKENFMRGVKDFLQQSVPAMVDYIIVVSTPTNEAFVSSTNRISNRYDRLSVVNALRQRASAMPVLGRESVPILPYLLDIPRHLAIIASAVIRNSREFQARPKPYLPTDMALHEFCSRCFEIEEIALLRVSQLAARVSSDRRRTPAPPLSNQAQVPGPSAATGEFYRSPVADFTGRSRTRKPSRPSTAPSPSESNTSRRRMFGDVPMATSQDFTPASARHNESSTNRRLRLVSTSTDSLPSLGAVPGSVQVTDLSQDMSDETGKRKRGLLRGILRR